MRPLVIDIETKPDSAVDTPEYWAWFQSNLEPPGNLKDPLKIQAALDDKVEKARGRMALSPITAMVSVIGLMPWNEETPIVLQAEQQNREAEAELLRTFDQHLSDYWDEAAPIITYNGRLFDLPMLAGRSAVSGVSLRIPKARDYRRHVDIFDDVFGKEGSQPMWFYAMGAGLPADVDHSQLTIADQAEKCAEDVLMLAELARRTQAIWGSR